MLITGEEPGSQTSPELRVENSRRWRMEKGKEKGYWRGLGIIVPGAETHQTLDLSSSHSPVLRLSVLTIVAIMLLFELAVVTLRLHECVFHLHSALPGLWI